VSVAAEAKGTAGRGVHQARWDSIAADQQALADQNLATVGQINRTKGGDR
jgi:hypothetical protein